MISVATANSTSTSSGLATRRSTHYPMVDVETFCAELEAAGFAVVREPESWHIFYVHHLPPPALYAQEMLVRRILVGDLTADGRIIATDNTYGKVFVRWLYRRFGACERGCDTCRWCKLQAELAATSQEKNEGAADASGN